MNSLFYIETFGCKLNQLDSERIREGLSAAGFVETGNPAEAQIIIVNACSVTGKAEKESRYRLRRVTRYNPDARCYLIGCVPEGTDPSTSGNTTVLPAAEKFNIPELTGTLPDFPTLQPHHARPLVHIQNGCDLSCSYCIVPSFRGPSRSIPVDAVLKQLDTAIAHGRGEVVLTGIHLGTWGKDLQPATTLLHLLQAIEDHVKERLRVRISSLDANEISDELIYFFSVSRMIQPHFHVPLQHGSTTVLKRMRRRYRPELYLDRVSALRNILSDACIGADVIPGFPGETDAEFEECVALIQQSPLNYLHVFPFSPRPGTDAARMVDVVPEPVKQARAKRLRDISNQRVREFRNRFIGSKRPAVMIYPDRALTDNYIPVQLDQPVADATGRAVVVTLLEHENGIVRAQCETAF